MNERKYLVRERLLRWLKSLARFSSDGRVLELDSLLAQPPASDEPSGDELWAWFEKEEVALCKYDGGPMVGGSGPRERGWLCVGKSAKTTGKDPKSAVLAAYRKTKEGDSDRA